MRQCAAIKALQQQARVDIKAEQASEMLSNGCKYIAPARKHFKLIEDTMVLCCLSHHCTLDKLSQIMVACRTNAYALVAQLLW